MLSHKLISPEQISAVLKSVLSPMRQYMSISVCIRNFMSITGIK